MISSLRRWPAADRAAVLARAAEFGTGQVDEVLAAANAMDRDSSSPRDLHALGLD